MALWPQNEPNHGGIKTGMPSGFKQAPKTFRELTTLPDWCIDDYSQSGHPADADKRHGRAIKALDVYEEFEEKLLGLPQGTLTKQQKFRFDSALSRTRRRIRVLSRHIRKYERRNEPERKQVVAQQHMPLLEVILAIVIGVLTFKWLSGD
jgi:hypothetical protein